MSALVPFSNTTQKTVKALLVMSSTTRMKMKSSKLERENGSPEILNLGIKSIRLAHILQY